jgi:hypothetical protein
MEVINLLSSPRELANNKKDMIEEIISFIGEPIIQNQLRALYNEKFGVKDEKDILIEKLQNELAKYK